MKKYVILGIIVLALATSFLIITKQDSTADMPSFYGTAEAGRTVYACLQPVGRCFQTTANANNNYSFPSTLLPGDYNLTDNCGNVGATYSGSPVRVDFCVPNPPWEECPCD
jgi:hypothetical protein